MLVAFHLGYSTGLPSFLPLSPAGPIFVWTGVNPSYADYTIVAYGVFVTVTFTTYVNARVDKLWSEVKDQPLQAQISARDSLKKFDIKEFLLFVVPFGVLALEIRWKQHVELGRFEASVNLIVYLLFVLILFMQLRRQLSRRSAAGRLTHKSDLLRQHDAQAREAGPDAPSNSTLKDVEQLGNPRIRQPELPAPGKLIFQKRTHYFAFVAIMASIGLIFFAILYVSPSVTERATTNVAQVEGVVTASRLPVSPCNTRSRRDQNYGVVTIKFTMSNGKDCTFSARTCRSVQAETKVNVQPASWTYCGGSIGWWLSSSP